MEQQDSFYLGIDMGIFGFRHSIMGIGMRDDRTRPRSLGIREGPDVQNGHGGHHDHGRKAGIAIYVREYIVFLAFASSLSQSFYHVCHRLCIGLQSLTRLHC